MPRTSYASFGMSDQQTCTRVRGEDSEDMTTIVSQKSVAEITWPHRESHVHHLKVFSATNCSRLISECSSLKRRDSTADSSGSPHREPRVAMGGFLLHHYTTSMNADNLLSDISQRRSSKQDNRTERTARITSFPRLLSRQCTDDWSSPPPVIDAVMASAPETLYRQGVDARTGSVSDQMPEFPQGQVKILRYDHDVFSKNPFCGDFEEDDVANLRDFPPTVTPRSRLGVSIGSASHRRRSSQVTALLKRQESHDGFFPTLIDKIRQRGHKIFHPHHSRRVSEEMRTPPSSEFTRSCSGMRSRDIAVKYLTPEPPKPDTAGIYEAMTGTRAVVSRCRNGQCSEDNRPHVCENDYLTPVGAASPV
ncbi:hypothetical protein B0T10DRAFT_480237 [Thelonectria olida]|uniref:Uncharacterized protein n=1 Tax=Thelonectria olida TaxID=1576542 RepID=A0A9P8W9U2_9HYPO|nr:hypothetical protein B0T10DRAFT_480237 [Thelonectria olida]